MLQLGFGSRRIGWRALRFAGPQNHARNPAELWRPAKIRRSRIGPSPAERSGTSSAFRGHRSRRGCDRYSVLAGLDSSELDDLGAIPLRNMDKSRPVVHLLRAAGSLAA